MWSPKCRKIACTLQLSMLIENSFLLKKTFALLSLAGKDMQAAFERERRERKKRSSTGVSSLPSVLCSSQLRALKPKLNSSLASLIFSSLFYASRCEIWRLSHHRQGWNGWCWRRLSWRPHLGLSHAARVERSRHKSFMHGQLCWLQISKHLLESVCRSATQRSEGVHEDITTCSHMKMVIFPQKDKRVRLIACPRSFLQFWFHERCSWNVISVPFLNTCQNFRTCANLGMSVVLLCVTRWWAVNRFFVWDSVLKRTPRSGVLRESVFDVKIDFWTGLLTIQRDRWSEPIFAACVGSCEVFFREISLSTPELT